MAAIHPPTDEVPPASPEYADPVDQPEEEPLEPQGDGEPPAAEAKLPPIVDPDGDLEELEDRTMPVERLLWAEKPNDGGIVERIYVQKGLSWFGKLELYGLLGQAVKVVLEGDNPLGIGSLVDLTRNPRQMMADMMGDLPGAEDAPGKDVAASDNELEAGRIMAAFAQVISIAPELLTQAYCIVLAIPKTHRNWAVEWAFPNMDDEMGQDILHTFVDQNWGVMEDFFAHELRKILQRVIKARQRGSAGPR